MKTLTKVKQFIVTQPVKISYCVGAVIALVILCKVGLLWLAVAGVWGLVHWRLFTKRSKQEVEVMVNDPTETVYEN